MDQKANFFRIGRIRAAVFRLIDSKTCIAIAGAVLNMIARSMQIDIFFEQNISIAIISLNVVRSRALGGSVRRR